MLVTSYELQVTSIIYVSVQLHTISTEIVIIQSRKNSRLFLYIILKIKLKIVKINYVQINC